MQQQATDFPEKEVQQARYEVLGNAKFFILKNGSSISIDFKMCVML